MFTLQVDRGAFGQEGLSVSLSAGLFTSDTVMCSHSPKNKQPNIPTPHFP